MLITAFLQWWYGAGWFGQFKALEHRVRNIAGMFSVDILLRTMFSPWKQIVSHARRDQSLGDKIRAQIDNIVSRFVGFFVRVLVLFAALVCMAGTAAYGTVILAAWPLLPLVPIVLALISAGVWPL